MFCAEKLETGFLRFLHHRYRMAMTPFIQWLTRKSDGRKYGIPDADRVLPQVAAAGENEITLSDLRVSMSRLERTEFDALIRAMIGSEIVIAYQQNGHLVLQSKF